MPDEYPIAAVMCLKDLCKNNRKNDCKTCILKIPEIDTCIFSYCDIIPCDWMIEPEEDTKLMADSVACDLLDAALDVYTP